jgi:hypothetical protein
MKARSKDEFTYLQSFHDVLIVFSILYVFSAMFDIFNIYFPLLHLY